MIVQWSKEARLDVEKALEYGLSFGRAAVSRFSKEIDDVQDLLEQNPKLGFVDSSLLNKAHIYRCFILRRYKVVYYLDEEKDVINIVAFFNTWQNPDKLMDYIE